MPLQITTRNPTWLWEDAFWHSKFYDVPNLKFSRSSRSERSQTLSLLRHSLVIWELGRLCQRLRSFTPCISSGWSSACSLWSQRTLLKTGRMNSKNGLGTWTHSWRQRVLPPCRQSECQSSLHRIGQDLRCLIFMFSIFIRNDREATVKQWAMSQEGGVLLVSKGQLGSSEHLPKADLVIIDEAHEVLKNQNTKAYALMSKLKTKRKIALTGTPLQVRMVLDS